MDPVETRRVLLESDLSTGRRATGPYCNSGDLARNDKSSWRCAEADNILDA
jgi:hypothetical protein